MRSIRSILDPSFRYVPSVATSVASTWRRAGWRPTTDEDRMARCQPTVTLVVDSIGAAGAPSGGRRVSVRVSDKGLSKLTPGHVGESAQPGITGRVSVSSPASDVNGRAA